MFHTLCLQHSVFRFDFLPLFPIDRSHSSSCPFICCPKKSFHICKPKVIYPSSHIILIILLAYRVTNSSLPVRQFSDFLLHLRYRLWVYSESAFSFVFIKEIPKVLGFADMLDEFALQKTMYELNEKIKLILNLMNQPQKNKSQKTMSFDEYMKEAKAINNIFIINVSISIKLYRNPYTF